MSLETLARILTDYAQKSPPRTLIEKVMIRSGLGKASSVVGSKVQKSWGVKPFVVYLIEVYRCRAPLGEPFLAMDISD